VSNYNLYRLGKKKGLPECMVAVKFEPMENWLPPGYTVRTNATVRNESSTTNSASVSSHSAHPDGKSGGDASGGDTVDDSNDFLKWTSKQHRQFSMELEECIPPEYDATGVANGSAGKIVIPYNLQTQHSLPDKSIADCVEALIGCYLSTCGQRAALLFMAWLDLKVLPPSFLPLPPTKTTGNNHEIERVSENRVNEDNGINMLVKEEGEEEEEEEEEVTRAESTPVLVSPLLTHVPEAHALLEFYLNGYEVFEEHIQYKFRDRSYLLQAFTHASYHYNTITDCYQRSDESRSLLLLLYSTLPIE